MKIGIDIDDTLIRSVESFLDFYNEKKNTNHKYEDLKTGTRFHEILGFNEKKHIYPLYKEYEIKGFSETIREVEGAQEVLEKLIKKHELILVTSRSKKLSEITKKVLKRLYPCFDFEILFLGLFDG